MCQIWWIAFLHTAWYPGSMLFHKLIHHILEIFPATSWLIKKVFLNKLNPYFGFDGPGNPLVIFPSNRYSEASLNLSPVVSNASPPNTVTFKHIHPPSRAPIVPVWPLSGELYTITVNISNDFICSFLLLAAWTFQTCHHPVYVVKIKKNSSAHLDWRYLPLPCPFIECFYR